MYINDKLGRILLKIYVGTCNGPTAPLTLRTPDENHPVWKTRLPTTLACLLVTLQLRSCTDHGHKGTHATLRQHSVLALENTSSAVSVSEAKRNFLLQYSVHFHVPVKPSHSLT
jgi:hypothetical protein